MVRSIKAQNWASAPPRKALSRRRGCPVVRHPRLAGAFLEFRMIPVLLWSFTAVLLGTGVAFAETGRFDVLWFLAALFLGTVIQGFVTHSLNEIYDWRSGTDRHASPRLLSGGSKVLAAGLLGERDLWRLFAASSATVGAVAAMAILWRSPWILLFAGTGYVAGVAYTAPPLRLSYRPFAGEWLGGFLGVFLAGTGAFFIQALTLTPLAVITAAAHASTCVGMLLVHHYLDHAADRDASPRKETTVVFLGLGRAKPYALAFALAALALTAAAAILSWAFLVSLAPLAAVAAAHHRLRPEDLASVTGAEIRIIQGGIVAGVLPAVLLCPFLVIPAILAVPAYAAHHWLATSPELAARAAAPAPAEG